MTLQNRRTTSLFDLIGRKWTINKPITNCIINSSGTTACFSTNDGHLALISLADDDAPQNRIRISGDTGRSTITPRTKPISEAKIIDTGAGVARPISVYKTDAFLMGDTDGRIKIISPEGHLLDTQEKLDGKIIDIDHHLSSGLSACISQEKIVIFGEDINKKVIFAQNGTQYAATSFSPDGEKIAATSENEISIWNVNNIGNEPIRISLNGTANHIHWKTDQEWILCTLENSGLALISLKSGDVSYLTDFPGPVSAADWCDKDNVFVASGAFRTTAWSLNEETDTAPSYEALQSGRSGLVLITMIATNNKNDFIAVGYENGQVLLTKPGLPDELLLHNEGSSISGLYWSEDAKYLAIAFEGGEAALIDFPPQMFK